MLALVMFMMFINDMMERVENYTSLFADDAKLLNKIREVRDCIKLQEEFNAK